MFRLKRNNYFSELVEYRVSKGDKDYEKIKEDRGLGSLKPRNLSEESSARAKRAVIEYALNNDFNFMVTITFDEKKIGDRHDYLFLKKKVLKYFSNLKHVYQEDLEYIVVPELHKDGALHFHGLFKRDVSRLKYLKPYQVNGENVSLIYVDEKMLEKFGANQWIVIYNRVAFVTYYITKYVTKSMDFILSAHYFCSRGLKKSMIVKETDFFDTCGLSPSFESPFVKKWHFEDSEKGILTINGVKE